MHIGFTGTQKGMTDKQLGELTRWLQQLHNRGYRTFHHGDCVGADEEAHDIAVALGYNIVIHPPNMVVKQAFCYQNSPVETQVRITVLEPKPYLERNHDIVDTCAEMVACPAEITEQVRSGTWATVRYARKRKKPLIILQPITITQPSVEVEPNGPIHS